MSCAKDLLPVFLVKREVPDEKLLEKVKRLMDEGKGMTEIRRILGVSDYKASRYYWQVRNGRW